ncbi:MAG: DegT/DnrJ/EryC1/StrS family aminotransferase [Nitrospirota bacterium]|nr:DegT/DnrJ/EryC1/StrS family aminotransferase [Nitrospirota bacterium]
MRIPLWRYLDDYASDRTRILERVDRVFSSGRLILGPEGERFERRFAGYCGARHGIGVNSGTDALFLAMKALGIGLGDEVITVANTAVPTVAAIRAAGAMPVFVDVEEDTFLLDVRLIEAAITPRTRAIVPVHLFGQPADMPAINAIAQSKKLHVLEDCAQAAGATFSGRRVGSLGDLAAFSFYPTKVLGGYGDGGMVVTNDPESADRVRRLRFYGMRDAYYSLEEGYNSRLDEVQAAILDLRLDTLDDQVARRRAIAENYTRELADVGDIVLPITGSDRTHQFYAYTIRTGSRDRLLSFLREKGIETKINYPVPVHLMSGYRFLGLEPGALPVTERLAGEILSLPLFPGLTEAEVGEVITEIRSFFRKA